MRIEKEDNIIIVDGVFQFLHPWYVSSNLLNLICFVLILVKISHDYDSRFSFAFHLTSKQTFLFVGSFHHVFWIATIHVSSWNVADHDQITNLSFI